MDSRYEKKKRLRRIITSKLNLGQSIIFLLMMKSGERERLKWREKR
jgi:hypothetical protein